MKQERVVGVGRVSRLGERDTATLEHQEERVREGAAREGGKLVAFFPEENVSGGAPLEKRTGLLSAVQMIEDGDAEILSVAYFDRLCRSIRVKDEVVTRVEDAGGRVVALDHGTITNGSAALWLSSTQTAAVAEYFRRNVSERTADSQRDAIAEGRPIIPRVPPGLRRSSIETARGRKNGPLMIDPDVGPIMQEAFRRRAGGARLEEVYRFMRENGIERSLGALSALLRNRLYIGEVSYREWTNPNAHPALIDRATFERVQRLHVPRGRKAKSERLLARLGLLRCGSCGARMSAATTVRKREDRSSKEYSYYYCRRQDRSCSAPAKIRADDAENAARDHAIEEGKAAGVRSAHGRASSRLDALKKERERVDLELLSAIDAFSGLGDVPAARAKLDGLKEERDRLDDEIRDLERIVGSAKRIATRGAWEDATTHERRTILLATFEQIVCLPDSRLEFVV